MKRGPTKRAWKDSTHQQELSIDKNSQNDKILNLKNITRFRPITAHTKLTKDTS